MKLTALIIFALTISPLVAQQNSSAGSEQQRLEQEVKSAIHFESLSSPGAHIELKASGEKNGLPGFSLVAQGIPKTLTYSLVQWEPFQGTGEVMNGIMLDQKGVVVCPGKPDTCGSPDKPNDPIDLRLAAAKGQPRFLALVGSDQHTKLMFVITPRPINAVDHGCTVEAWRLLPRGEVIIIRGNGFTPNEHLSGESNSEGEKKRLEQETDANGTFNNLVLLPFTGKKRGTTNVKLIGKTCAPELRFQWGEGSEK